jgi:DNA-binding transcriptional LysR family regulator
MRYIVIMREVDLRRVDLNLLVALQALLEERGVTRAAQRLGMSQPAVSRALGRLRALFADALLVEAPGGYALSARAEQIRPALRRTLAGIGELLEANAFDPAEATGRVRLLMPDLHAAALGPPLLAHLSREAPGLDLDILAPGPAVIEALENDIADAAVGVFEGGAAGILRRSLYQDRFMTLMRAGHPAAVPKLTLERYLDLSHLVVSVTGIGPAPVDQMLSVVGRKRRVKVRVPNFFAAIEIAAHSDLVMTLPSSLVALPPPVDPGRFAISLVWHARYQDAPRHVWLRQTIVKAAADIAAGELPAESRSGEGRSLPVSQHTVATSS